MTDLPLMLSSLLRADLTAAVKNGRTLIIGALLGFLVILSTRSEQGARPFAGHAYAVGVATAVTLMTTAILGYAMSMGRDRESGVLRRLQVTPAPGWAIIASRMAAQAISALVLALVIVTIGSRIDSLSLSAAQYALVLAFSMLGIVVFLSVGQALVGLIRSAAAVNAAGRAVFLVLVVLGLLGQAGALGGAWATIAPWTPLGAIMTLYARVLDLAGWSSRDTESLLACAGYIVILAAAGIRWFRWEAR
jgi:ABC-2 type transport system permease protein